MLADGHRCLRIPTPTIRQWVAESDPSVENELGRRLYVGCHIAQDRVRAVRLWKGVRSSFRTIPWAIYREAVLHLASHHLRQYQHLHSIRELLQAAAYIREVSSSTGIPSVIALKTWSTIRAIKDDEHGAWSVLTAREKVSVSAVVEEANLLVFACAKGCINQPGLPLQLPPRSKRPPVRCGREGCSIVLPDSARSMVFRCGGSCATELKPFYCGRVCQKIHWPEHKKVCGARAARPRTVVWTMLDGTVVEVDVSNVKSTMINHMLMQLHERSREVRELQRYSINLNLSSGIRASCN
ncbi:hypothetical protein BV25DRAFT_711468 [Artomyces pyxidatus]|uniref:Uncharacterized protein n=1 Tax=Artomyces pyxidatus TaxID=48021 RepID=A0ACB8T194_9AGAM|nr:hypothetical protein BV25DRAFT_711468 [Artomyces pyxidatus]